MKLSANRLSKLLACSVCCLLLCGFSGCSSLGIGFWPTQFQLLSKTRELASAAPLPAGMPHELSKRALPEYFVEPGDRILIEPVDLESNIGSFGDQKVQIDGTIDLGEFGRIRVTGMTVEEIEQGIEAQIAMSGEREAINVQIAEANASQVYVLGEVGSPAAYPLDGHEHVLDAILRAGGITSKASPCDIVLVRPTDPGQCRVVLPICYRQITQVGDVTTNYHLQPGDRIVVGSRSFCEEMAFWKQKNSCDRCCRSCCVECRPTAVNYKGRFAPLLQSFLPPQQSFPNPDTPSSKQQNRQTDAGSSSFQDSDSVDSNSLEQDKEIFLPSLITDPTEKD